MKKTSNIYIAGHTGLVGLSLVKKLEEEGYKNLILKTREELDLLNQKDVATFFSKEKPEYVFLLAAKVGSVQVNLTCPADFLFENLTIQNNVIWQAHLNGVKKLLFVGSSASYPKECKQPIKEEYLMQGPFAPAVEGYALAKLAGVRLCEKINKQYKKNFISCMPPNIYGVNDHFDGEGAHVVPALIKRMYEAKNNGTPQVDIWGTGDAQREFFYVEDLVDTLIFLMKLYESSETINVGTGIATSIKDVAFLIKEIVGYEGELFFDATKPSGAFIRVLDITKLKDLGFKQKTTVRQGIEKTYKYYLESKRELHE